MLKPMLAVTATGIVALILWKALAILLIPLIGIALGMVITLFKIIAAGRPGTPLPLALPATQPERDNDRVIAAPYRPGRPPPMARPMRWPADPGRRIL